MYLQQTSFHNVNPNHPALLTNLMNAAALSLCRNLLRCAKTLPTSERRVWLRNDVLNSFRENAVASSTEVDELMRNGEKMLELLSLRPQALSLYRRLLRASSHMPTANRAEFVRRKARR